MLRRSERNEKCWLFVRQISDTRVVPSVQAKICWIIIQAFLCSVLVRSVILLINFFTPGKRCLPYRLRAA
jgi:hypothetical protein